MMMKFTLMMKKANLLTCWGLITLSNCTNCLADCHALSFVLVLVLVCVFALLCNLYFFQLSRPSTSESLGWYVMGVNDS